MSPDELLFLISAGPWISEGQTQQTVKNSLNKDVKLRLNLHSGKNTSEEQEEEESERSYVGGAVITHTV